MSEARALSEKLQQRQGGELRQLLQGMAQAPGPAAPALPQGFVLDTPNTPSVRAYVRRGGITKPAGCADGQTCG
jgi:hypothetical protein